MQHYMKELFNALRERGLDLKLPIVFAGGGAELLGHRLHSREVNTISSLTGSPTLRAISSCWGIQQDNAKLARIKQEAEAQQKELVTVFKQFAVEWRIGKSFHELDEFVIADMPFGRFNYFRFAIQVMDESTVDSPYILYFSLSLQ